MNKKSVNELRKEHGLEPIKDSICDEKFIADTENAKAKESTQLKNSEDAEINVMLSVLETKVNSLTNLIRNGGSLHALEIILLIFILFWLVV